MQISISNVIGRAANLITYAARLIKEFKARVATYPGSVFEAQACLTNTLNTISRIDLLNDASLVITPNAYNETKLYSVVPNTTLGDMDVVRATTATRVNEQGLVEVVPYNTYTYSEQFDNSSWVKTNCTIEPNSIISPNGTLTADKVISTAIGSPNVQKNINSAEIINHVVSIFAKKGTSDILELQSGPVGVIGVFNLTTGTIVSGSNTTITSFGDGWYRCTALVPSFVDYAAQYFIIKNATIGSYLYLWGVQAEKGSVPNKYFPTTTRLNIPRIDYTNGTCPSLLVEPQRTNLATYSEDFSNASWSKARMSITPNTITSPSGILNADSFVEDTSLDNHPLYRTFNTTINTTYTFSIFVKQGSRRYVRIAITDIIYYDLLNKTASAGGEIIDFGNGWLRLVYKFTATSSNSTLYIEPSINGVTTIYQGNGSVSSYIWGAQLEAGSNATSYIPTVASTVTRNADVISKTGISSLIGTAEGSAFFEGTVFNQGSDINGVFFEIVNGNTGVNTITIFITNSGIIHLFIGIFGINVPLSSVSFSGQKFKIAFRWKAGDYSFYLNGVQVYTNTSGTLTGLNTIRIGSNRTGAEFPMKTQANSAILWNTSLSNTELAQLTTL